MMLNRPSERANRVLAECNSQFKDMCSLVHCDLQRFDSVRDAAGKVKEAFGAHGLDVLVCNAGVMALKDVATPDGYDVQMQTNHLSHFLLTAELWPVSRDQDREMKIDR